MKSNTTGNGGKKERAKELVRDVLISEFGQKVDESTIDTIADKVLRSLPSEAKRRPASRGVNAQRAATHLPGNLASGIAALLTGASPGACDALDHAKNTPANGRRGDKIPTPIVGPSPITTASAAPTQDAAPANPHR